MAKLLDRNNPLNLFFINCLIILAIWLVYFSQLIFEWNHNPQYSYGIFVPLMGLYLLHLRWEDSPQAQAVTKDIHSKVFLVFLSIIVIFAYPLKIINYANTEWRLLLWLEGFILFGISTLFLGLVGGKRWILHFYFPFFFLLTSIPWPTFLETKIIHDMLKTVTTATVELMNLIGIYAIQNGNTVTLSSGTVNVSDACSGIRSFQSSIMISLFLGEFFRFPYAIRFTVLGLSCTFAFILNIARTWTLTILSAKGGAELTNQWHDPIGYIIFFVNFFILLILCFLLKKYFNRPKTNTSKENIRPILSIKISITYILLILFTIPTTWAYFYMKAQDLPKDKLWTVNFDNFEYPTKEKKIPQPQQDTLFYDRGINLEWMSIVDNHFLTWYFYLIEWDHPNKAQLAGFHSPENCLPSAGWKLEDNGELYIWEREGIKLIFILYEFTFNKRRAYVFMNQWDPSGFPYHELKGRTRIKRIYDAFHGYTRSHKKVLEVAIATTASKESIKVIFDKFLSQTIQLEE